MPVKYLMVIAYFGNLIGLSIFLSVILGGVYFVYKVYKDIVYQIFGSKDYDKSD